MAMRVDVHTHIFPPEVVQEREKYFPAEPAFRLLYGSAKARLITAESLLESMDQEGIDRSVVFGFPWRNSEMSARHNDYVLEAAARHEPRLIPLGCVDPLSEGGLAVARRSLENGAKGLGELAIYGPCDTQEALKRYRELIGYCRSFEVVLMVHANEPVGHLYPGKAPLGLDFYYELARAAAGLDLILAHWGGGLGFFQLLKKEVGEVLGRVYYDTAASPFLYRPEVYRQMLAIVGREKILFGSDYPLLSPGRYFKEMEEAGLTGEQVEAIGGGNAVRLFRL